MLYTKKIINSNTDFTKLPPFSLYLNLSLIYILLTKPLPLNSIIINICIYEGTCAARICNYIIFK